MGQCRDAKLSVLDWDDSAHTIHTSSLHYFEGDPSLRMGRTVFPLGPKAVTDPQVLCFTPSHCLHHQRCGWIKIHLKKSMYLGQTAALLVIRSPPFRLFLRT